MNIFLFELKMIRSFIITWASSISGFLILYMVFFPTMMADNTGYEEMMSQFPEEFLAFFNMDPNVSFTSILGYYGLTMSFVLIPLGIQAAYLGFSVLSIEEREFTADFLMTKPVSRKSIYMNKVLASITGLLITNITVWIVSIICVNIFNGGQTVEMQYVYKILSSLIFMQLFFLSVGLVISVSLRRVSSVISYSMGLGFGLFFVSSFGDMLSNKPLQILGVYGYFDPIYIIANNSLNWGMVPIAIVASILSFTGAYFLYNRRNIASL